MKKINKNMGKKIVYTEKERSDITGELEIVKTIERKDIKTEERFHKLYIDDIGSIIKCSNSEKNFILCCLSKKFVEYETNEIVLNKARKEEIALCAGVDIKSVHNCLYNLIKKNIIIRNPNKTFLLNPKLFFTGDERSRSKMFGLKLKYSLSY